MLRYVDKTLSFISYSFAFNVVTIVVKMNMKRKIIMKNMETAFDVIVICDILI